VIDEFAHFTRGKFSAGAHVGQGLICQMK